MYSSSKGNATFIGSKTAGILIDAGVSCKRLVDGLAMGDIDIKAVKAVFITHEHSDHIAGLLVLTKNFNIPVYAQDKTLISIISKNKISSKVECGIIDDNGIYIGDYYIKCFNTFHDTEQSCGYCIHTPDDKKISVCTDLGVISQEVRSSIIGSDFVLLESNYDKQMLKTGGYPYYLKKRIESDHGHLCNEDSAIMVKELVESGTSRIVLGHLSQENNTPSKALECSLKELSQYKRDSDYILDVAPVVATGKKYIL